MTSILYYGPGCSGKHYLKDILIYNSFSFEDKDPRFTQAKTRSCTEVAQSRTILWKGYAANNLNFH